MVKSLSKLKKDTSDAEDTTTAAVEPNNNNTTYANAKSGTKLVTPYRYQTITFETMGYSGANVDVRPYGIAKYHFVAEFDNELGLNEGDMVYLVRYVDNEWLEAEIDSSRRQVPIAFSTLLRIFVMWCMVFDVYFDQLRLKVVFPTSSLHFEGNFSHSTTYIRKSASKLMFFPPRRHKYSLKDPSAFLL